VITYSPPSRQLSNGIRAELSEKELMSRTGEEIDVLPPKFDDDGNPLVVEKGSKSGTSKTPTLEDLMKKLEKLKAENKKLKAKGKKGKT
jgi:hypothetical protein